MALSNLRGGEDVEKQGLFIVLEGTDGSGKNTQAKLLTKRLRDQGYNVETFDFPRYQNPSSFFVREYLNGKYGPADQVSPYTSSLFYALDRYQTAPLIRQALKEGKIVLCDRFTGSNMAHQGTKFLNSEEQRGFFIWLDNLEFELLKIPRPHKNFVLRVPADIAQSLVDKKPSRDYTDLKRDAHEADITHMKRSVEVYDNLCQLFPKDFTSIDCVRSGELMDISTISDVIWESVKPLLPDKKPNYTPAKPESSSSLLAKSKSGALTVSPAGEEYLDSIVTNVKSNVYAFTDQLSPVTIAAAMARLSRRGDDMRVTILDEFTNKAHKDQDLLRRVITAYGDDSVQQLIGQHMVVENASNLLTKKLEWGRLAAYLEQSTRYIYFDQKDKDGRYKYYIPTNLPKALQDKYCQSMDFIFDNYSKIVRELTNYVRKKSNTPKDQQDIAWQGATRAQACDAARSVLPVAVTSTVGIYASGQALESLILHLLSDDMDEMRVTGQSLLKEARKAIPTFLERADKPERGGAWIAHKANTAHNIRSFAKKVLPTSYSTEAEDVELVDVWPRNELDLVPDMLYEFTQLSLTEIRKITAKMPYAQKQEIFTAYMGERLNRRHKPGRAMEKAHYSWDILCDFGIFRDLQRHRMVDDLQWQLLTPRYGYEVPKLVEKAGLTDIFEQCFDASLELHSKMCAQGFENEAQYATLLGHKMRWKVTYNAREAFHLHELRTSPQGHPNYRKLVKKMHDKLCEVHPLIGEAMIFVNKDEDPELTRLAAERYTQFKLNQISKA